MPPNPEFDRSAAVTVVITRRVKPGREAAYEAWLARLIAAAGELRGYLGADIHRPSPGARELARWIYPRRAAA